MKKPSLKKSRRASALVITLALVVLLCIMVVGLTARARLESVSSSVGLARVQSSLYTQAAIDTALAKLRGVVSTNSTNFWTSQPGRLITMSNGVATPVDLSSGLGTAGTNSVNLNIGTITNSSAGVITGGGDAMWANWIYVVADPVTGVTSLSPTLPTANAVGRFAYWVDDETSKVNLNTADMRTGNTNVSAHPSQVDLGEVGLTAADVASYRTGNHYFQAVSEASVVDSGASNAIANNGFAMTVHNMSPDLNMFGEPRIVLTTKQTNAGTNNTNFLNILVNQGADPGMLTNIDYVKYNTVVTRLVKEFTRTDWPIASGQSVSVAAKFADVNQASAPYQLAANIIDYVRCAESTNECVEPIEAALTIGGSPAVVAAIADLPAKSLIGYTRGPIITEFGAYAPAAPNTNMAGYTHTGNTGTFNYEWPVTVEARIHLDPACPTIDLANYAINLHVQWKGTNKDGSTMGLDIPTGIKYGVNSSSIYPIVAGSTLLAPGAYYTYSGTKLIDSTNSTKWGNNFPDLTLRFGIVSRNNGTKTPSGLPGAYFGLVSAVGFAGPLPATLPAVHSIYITDPGVNNATLANAYDWHTNTTGNNFNSQTAYTPPTVSTVAGAPQDTVSSAGPISTNGVQFPHQAFTALNPFGQVQTVGELGFVHTGINTSVANVTNGVPWRSIHLQPVNTQGQLPDWAILDLFSAPIPQSELDTAGTNGGSFYIRPTMTGTVQRVGGKINLNGQIAPFAAGGGTVKRLQPLEAMLSGATNSGGAISPGNMAASISQMSLASGAQNPSGTNQVYYSPAQIVDVQGLATAGDESSEGVIRQLVDLGTTRSYVYSIYAVGQALKQDKAGVIHVLGERRQVATYEYSRTGTSAGGQTIPLDFQCISSQDITP